MAKDLETCHKSKMSLFRAKVDLFQLRIFMLA